MDYTKRPLKRKPEMAMTQTPTEKPSLKRAESGRSAEMQKVDAMTASLVQELMNAATSFHKLHLQVTGTGSYAQHKALNKIYDALPDLADSIAEGYQGACEMLLKYEPQGPVVLESVEDAIEYMRQIKGQVDELQAVMHHSEIVNILDTVKDAVNSAKYKLIFLA
jgi:DNA-binding ferritin-like protein